METRLHSGPVAEAQAKPAAWRLPWVDVAIVGVALLLRLLWLEMKPPHFDEGVNGWFVDRMTEQGFYHYDPTNFHGPLHFYILFLAQTLLGRHAWALRLPVALIGAACVWLALGYRRFLGERTCQWAAGAMALSPAFTFYSRYAIHEMELLLFLMLAAWGLLGLARFPGEKRYLWAAALGLTGCVLTKETYAIHFIAFALAVPAVFIVERLTKRREGERLEFPWNDRQLLPVGAVCVGLIVFFYSGGLLDWSSLPGLVTTFQAWVATGVDADGGHNKEWYYWLELMVDYEWPALVGLAVSAWFLWREKDRSLRWLILGGWAVFFAYSVVRYKTPWCLICMVWPLYFAFGRLIESVQHRLGACAAAALALLALGHSTWRTTRLNFRDYTNENEPYVYVQTLPSLERIMGPLRRHVAGSPANLHLPGFLLYPPGGAHPLLWLLAEYTHIELLDEHRAPSVIDADFLLIDDPFVSDVEERLQETYFRETIVLRGASGESAQLYLRASTFAYQFPGRTPEFRPQRAPRTETELKQESQSIEERVRALEEYLKNNSPAPKDQ